MKKWCLIIICSLVLSGCSLTPQRSGVEIMSSPPAKVYIDNKEAGMTPYKNNNLKPGEIEIKLVSESGREWKKEVRLENYADTVIDWEFGDNMSGYVLTLERIGSQKAGLLVNVNPNSAAIAIDGEIKGFSPLKIEDIGEGDKQISLSYPGYLGKTIFAKGIIGYQLVIESDLAEEVVSVQNTSTPISTEASASATLVQIKTTETGWLRVRETPSASGIEVARVKPGEKYMLLEESKDWNKIKISETLSGWVSVSYTVKVKSAEQ